MRVRSTYPTTSTTSKIDSDHPKSGCSHGKTYLEINFKTHALEYFREVEQTGQPLIITDHGRPVLKIEPYTEDSQALLASLRGSVLHYDDPLEPVGIEDWEALK